MNRVLYGVNCDPDSRQNVSALVHNETVDTRVNLGHKYRYTTLVFRGQIFIGVDVNTYSH